MNREYILKPSMTFTTVASAPAPGKPADRATDELVNALLPDALKARPASPPPAAPPADKSVAKPALPARQPLPTPVIEASSPVLKPGLNIHQDFIMASHAG